MDCLNYHRLRYSWTVAKEGREKAHVSQPYISEQICEPEESLGENLFRREGTRELKAARGHSRLRG